jgi:serine/threonine-protein phosphatase 2A regulatory subunit A
VIYLPDGRTRLIFN